MSTKSYSGLLRVGNYRIALPADQLREVILHPGKLHPLPDAGPCMDGTFSLRGRCVPVLNLTRLLGIAESAAPFIAITRWNGNTLGICVEDILKVSAVPSEAQFHMAGQSRSPRLFSHCFHDAEDHSLIHILDLAALHSCDGVRTAAEPDSASEHESDTAGEGTVHLALFSVGGRSFAVPRSAVWKALPAGQITERVSAMGLLRGYLLDNGIALPVLDLLGALALPPAPGALPPNGAILLEHRGRKIGFEIDGVIGSSTTSPRHLTPLGDTSAGKANQLSRSGCRMLNSKEYGFVIALDLQALLEGEELRNATAHQKRPATDPVPQLPGQSARAKPISFVTYRVQSSRFCTPLVEVEAIVPLPDFLSLAGEAEYFRGVMEWRNQVVNLFDLSMLLTADSRETSTSISEAKPRRVLIVREPGLLGPELSGYLVDDVEALTSAVSEPVPSLVTQSWASRCGPALPAITEMIQISASSGARSNVNVLHLSGCETTAVLSPLAPAA